MTIAFLENLMLILDIYKINKCCFKTEIFLFLYLYVIFTCMCIEKVNHQIMQLKRNYKILFVNCSFLTAAAYALSLCFKIMLLDEFTTRLLSSCCKMTDLLEEGVTGECALLVKTLASECEFRVGRLLASDTPSEDVVFVLRALAITDLSVLHCEMWKSVQYSSEILNI